VPAAERRAAKKGKQGDCYSIARLELYEESRFQKNDYASAIGIFTDSRLIAKEKRSVSRS